MHGGWTASKRLASLTLLLASAAPFIGLCADDSRIQAHVNAGAAVTAVSHTVRREGRRSHEIVHAGKSSLASRQLYGPRQGAGAHTAADAAEAAEEAKAAAAEAKATVTTAAQREYVIDDTSTRTVSGNGKTAAEALAGGEQGDEGPYVAHAESPSEKDGAKYDQFACDVYSKWTCPQSRCIWTGVTCQSLERTHVLHQRVPVSQRAPEHAAEAPHSLVHHTPYKFNCIAGNDNYESGWSDDKRAWCCLHRKEGCRTEERIPVRTRNGVQHLEVMSTPLCSNRRGGVSEFYPCKCGETLHATTKCDVHQFCTATSDLDAICEYDCNEERGWTDAKVSWCCARQNIKCDEHSPRTMRMEGVVRHHHVARGGAAADGRMPYAGDTSSNDELHSATPVHHKTNAVYTKSDTDAENSEFDNDDVVDAKIANEKMEARKQVAANPLKDVPEEAREVTQLVDRELKSSANMKVAQNVKDSAMQDAARFELAVENQEHKAGLPVDVNTSEKDVAAVSPPPDNFEEEVESTGDTILNGLLCAAVALVCILSAKSASDGASKSTSEEVEDRVASIGAEARLAADAASAAAEKRASAAGVHVASSPADAATIPANAAEAESIAAPSSADLPAD